MEPLVSVIIPTYQGEAFIEEAIESVIAQTYPNWELWLIDDYSHDLTLSKIKSFRDPRIHILENERNRGISYSTNQGIIASKGKFIALLDQDDRMFPERLALQVDYLQKETNIDILGGMSVYIDEEGSIMKYDGETLRNPNLIKARLLFQNTGFCNGTAMIRKEFILKHQLFYQEECLGMQDFRFYMESSKLGNISSINRFLLYSRQHPYNETKRVRATKNEERKKLYAQFQRESLKASGFRLDEPSFDLIHQTMAEVGGRCHSKGEWKDLFRIFQDLLDQAKSLELDYQKELNYYLKAQLAKQLTKLELFR